MSEIEPESAHTESFALIERPSELLNYQEAARFLRISRGTLENWISSGLYDIPHIKVGRLIRFRTSSLSRWLESRERGSSQLAESSSP